MKHFGGLSSGADDDPDSDGLSNVLELQNGTDPNEADTDRDGMKDGDEVGRGYDPLDGDQDRNGILDGSDDWDGDAEDNRTELTNGTDPGDVPGVTGGGGVAFSCASGGNACPAALVALFGLLYRLTDRGAVQWARGFRPGRRAWRQTGDHGAGGVKSGKPRARNDRRIRALTGPYPVC